MLHIISLQNFNTVPFRTSHLCVVRSILHGSKNHNRRISSYSTKDDRRHMAGSLAPYSEIDMLVEWDSWRRHEESSSTRYQYHLRVVSRRKIQHRSAWVLGSVLKNTLRSFRWHFMTKEYRQSIPSLHLGLIHTKESRAMMINTTRNRPRRNCQEQRDCVHIGSSKVRSNPSSDHSFFDR